MQIKLWVNYSEEENICLRRKFVSLKVATPDIGLGPGSDSDRVVWDRTDRDTSHTMPHPQTDTDPLGENKYLDNTFSI